MVAAFRRPRGPTAGQGSVRDQAHAQSAISNRLAGPLPVVQNSAVVEKYLRLIGNKIENWTSIAGSQTSGGTQASRVVGKRLLASTQLTGTVPLLAGVNFQRKFVAAGYRNQHARRALPRLRPAAVAEWDESSALAQMAGVGVARGCPVVRRSP